MPKVMKVIAWLDKQISEDQRADILRSMEILPHIGSIAYASSRRNADAYMEIFADQLAVVGTTSTDTLPAYFEILVASPAQARSLKGELVKMPGVAVVTKGKHHQRTN